MLDIPVQAKRFTMPMCKWREAMPRWCERAWQYALLARLHQPVGTLLLLWPTLWALWIAGEGDPGGSVLWVFLCGVFLMRSAGCVINDLADRHIDPGVGRTAGRPIASGKVTPKEALAVFTTLCLSAFGLVLLLNTLTVLLSLAGLVLAATYPFAKRFTYIPQAHLGIAFGWAVPMAFAAQTGAVAPVAWLLLVAVVLWTVAYDTMYAMADREDDLYLGVKSTAILLGQADRAFVCGLQVAVVLVLVLVGQQLKLTTPYYLGLFAACVLFAWQQYLIGDRAPANCLRAFAHNNWVGAAVFTGLAASYWPPGTGP